jgi:hypothetical protein
MQTKMCLSKNLTAVQKITLFTTMISLSLVMYLQEWQHTVKLNTVQTHTHTPLSLRHFHMNPLLQISLLLTLFSSYKYPQWQRIIVNSMSLIRSGVNIQCEQIWIEQTVTFQMPFQDNLATAGINVKQSMHKTCTSVGTDLVMPVPADKIILD